MFSKLIVMKILFSLIILTSLTACGGGGSKTTVINRSTTSGQELVDLKSAFDKGAISQREYDAQKKIILTRD